jgi:hypothetical protein
VTEKALPAVGFEPPFTEVTTSRSESDETVNAADVAVATASPLVRVAASCTPASALV